MNKITSYIQNSKINFVEIAEFILEYLHIGNITLNIFENADLLKKLSNENIDLVAFLERPFYNNYILWVKPNTLTGPILCHELWHLKQYFESRLKVVSNYKKVYWEGNKYTYETPYNERPWEQEALAMQRKLWKMYKSHKKQKERKLNNKSKDEN